MKCPYCLIPRTKVIDKRNLEDLETIKRRRECLECGKRFTTHERIEFRSFSIIKKDGSRENFDRDKLTKGLLKACEKRPVSRDKIERIASEIEAELRTYDKNEILSTKVGELVMEQLIDLDKVAYIRFASVYRDFTDLNSFAKELKALMKSHINKT